MKTYLLADIPWVDRHAMMEIDSLMIEEYHISLLQMMENAGRNLADLADNLMENDLRGKSVGVLCGGGNNGGGGMAAARQLANRGAHVQVSIAAEEGKLRFAPAEQLKIIHAMRLDISNNFPVREFDLMIDALIGYGLRVKPDGRYTEWINRLNAMQNMTRSLDVPSGMDADSGEAPGAVVKTDATLTLGLPKKGMLNKDTGVFIGDLYLADISVPADLLRRIGIPTSAIFQAGPIVKLARVQGEPFSK